MAAAPSILYQGATQIKMAISGGVISYGDPLHVHEFTPKEIEAAEDFGTSVMVPVHGAAPIKQASDRWTTSTGRRRKE
jgi:hypothetical protein